MMLKKTLATVGTAGLLTAGSMGLVAPAQAAPIVTGGLVNVTVVDLLDVTLTDVNVALGAALGLAANVCDVNVNVLARQLRTGGATCTSTASGQTVTISQI